MKFKIVKELPYDTIYYLYVKKLFRWSTVTHFSSGSTDVAIDKGKELAHQYKYPVAEFEL